MTIRSFLDRLGAFFIKLDETNSLIDIATLMEVCANGHLIPCLGLVKNVLTEKALSELRNNSAGTRVRITDQVIHEGCVV